MSFADIKSSLVTCNEEEKTEILYQLIIQERRKTSLVTKKFLNMYIFFVICHLETKSRYQGIEHYCKLIKDNINSFSNIEKEDIFITSHYLYQKFKYDYFFKHELEGLFDVFNRDFEFNIFELERGLPKTG
ncbi:hypothetical protein AB990_07530 [Alkalihalobacillus pseudalcaliphilus]|nr:hypothetical protein AB990_07530 [Alkalihalobacillus pseudalcaliphilus]